MGKYRESEKDCEKVMKLKKVLPNNAGRCVEAMCLYNLAVIQSHFYNTDQALKHLHELLEITNNVCSLILEKDVYNKMQQNNMFVLSNDVSKCFEQCKTILAAIYGSEHPYVTDYLSYFPINTK